MRQIQRYEFVALGFVDRGASRVAKGCKVLQWLQARVFFPLNFLYPILRVITQKSTIRGDINFKPLNPKQNLNLWRVWTFKGITLFCSGRFFLAWREGGDHFLVYLKYKPVHYVSHYKWNDTENRFSLQIPFILCHIEYRLVFQVYEKKSL